MRISDWSSDVCSSDLKRVSLWLRGFVRKNSDQPPAQRFARVEGDDFADAVGDDRLAAFQRQRAGVERQAVSAWVFGSASCWESVCPFLLISVFSFFFQYSIFFFFSFFFFFFYF